MKIRDFREHFLSLTPEMRQEVMALYRELLTELGESEVAEYHLDYDTNENPHAVDNKTVLLCEMKRCCNFLADSLQQNSVLEAANWQSRLNSAIKEYKSEGYQKEAPIPQEYLAAAEQWIVSEDFIWKDSGNKNV